MQKIVSSTRSFSFCFILRQRSSSMLLFFDRSPHAIFLQFCSHLGSDLFKLPQNWSLWGCDLLNQRERIWWQLRRISLQFQALWFDFVPIWNIRSQIKVIYLQMPHFAPKKRQILIFEKVLAEISGRNFYRSWPSISCASVQILVTLRPLWLFFKKRISSISNLLNLKFHEMCFLKKKSKWS